jgi:hypothetical protein
LRTKGGILHTSLMFLKIARRQTSGTDVGKDLPALPLPQTLFQVCAPSVCLLRSIGETGLRQGGYLLRGVIPVHDLRATGE